MHKILILSISIIIVGNITSRYRQVGIVMSNFTRDLRAEQELGKYLDSNFYPNYTPLKNVHRVFTKKEQLEGIDIVANFKGEKVLIDEKGCLTKTIPIETFALEISYKFKGNRKQGWLYNKEKRTTHYLLCWNKRDSDIGIDSVTADDFDYVVVMLVSRQKLLKYLQDEYGITMEVVSEKIKDILKNNKKGKLEYLGENSKSYYYYSTNSEEEPINIVMQKSELMESGVVESYILVKKNGELRDPSY